MRLHCLVPGCTEHFHVCILHDTVQFSVGQGKVDRLVVCIPAVLYWVRHSDSTAEGKCTVTRCQSLLPNIHVQFTEQILYDAYIQLVRTVMLSCDQSVLSCDSKLENNNVPSCTSLVINFFLEIYTWTWHNKFCMIAGMLLSFLDLRRHTIQCSRMDTVSNENDILLPNYQGGLYTHHY